MKAFVSLWSADLLALGDAVDLLDDVVDGYHLDVFDGHRVPELLFGPDLVNRLRSRTAKPIEAHLTVMDADAWAPRFLDAGADVVTVHIDACADVGETLEGIRARGAVAGLGLEVHESVHRAAELFDHADRLLLMGTRTGIKGVGLDPQAGERIRSLVDLRAAAGRTADLPIVVDGGIRANTIGGLAAAGADGVVPGSLVFGSADRRAAVQNVHALPVGTGDRTDRTPTDRTPDGTTPDGTTPDGTTPDGTTP